MPEPQPPPADDAHEATEHDKTTTAKRDARKALAEQQKRELPSNDWPGKGAA